MARPVTEVEVLDALRKRPKRGPVKLTWAQADWLIHHLEYPPLTRDALRVMVDQAKRARMNERGAACGREAGMPRGPKPPRPVLAVPLRMEPIPSDASGNLPD